MVISPVIEILATGDEVTAGDVLDSDGAYASTALTRLGYFVARHTVVPDDSNALTDVIGEISRRADVCVCSGGMGPTEDDLTVDVVQKVTGVPVRMDPEVLECMKRRSSKGGMRFSDNMARSARVPEGSEVYQNEAGTAPAFSIRIDRCRFFFLPGVPREFKFFVDRHVLPEIRRSYPGVFGRVRQLKTLGVPEAHLAETFPDWSTRHPEVKLGYRAHQAEVWVKLTAVADSSERLQALLSPAESEVRAKLGDLVFGEDGDELSDVVHRLLLKQKSQLVTAESCTGGGLGQMITAHPGSSAYYRGGVVSYSNALKESLLGVPAEVLNGTEAPGAVSTECARAMALGALRRIGGDYACAITGIAGPDGGSEAKPVGLVYVALASGDGASSSMQVRVVERRFRGDRARIQRASALTALEMLRREILGLPPLRDGSA